jgi:hypothetical protein
MLRSKIVSAGIYYLYFFAHESEILLNKIIDEETIYGNNWVQTDCSGYFEGNSINDVKFVPSITYNPQTVQYQLSQEEIDALVKELKESYETPKIMPVIGYNGPKPEVLEPKQTCMFHEWVPYIGLFESFDHCKKCGEKKK